MVRVVVRWASRIIAFVYLLGLGAPAVANAAPTLYTGNAGPFVVSPPIIELSGDGTATLGGPGWKAPEAFVGMPGTSGRPTSYGAIRWSQFGGAVAKGSGVYWLDDGIPDDSAGTFHRYAAQIEASGLQGDRYTSLSWRFTADGVRVHDRRTLSESEGLPTLWRSSGAETVIDYCPGPPVFVPGDVVVSAVGLSCGAAQNTIHRHVLRPEASLFRSGRHVEHVAGFRCTSSNFRPKARTPDLPPFIRKGSGDAQCTSGGRGFFFTYAE